MDMIVRKLENFRDRMEAERLVATSFLHEWDEKEAEEAAGSPKGDVWGAFDGSGHMVSAITTIRKSMMYEGSPTSCVELHMVGTLPEERGSGAVRKLMDHILHEYRENGDLFSVLIPFSFAFYRKFGFEAASEMLDQKAGIDQFAGFAQEMKAIRIASQRDVDEAHRLYDAFAAGYNLAELKDASFWTCRENGEFGSRDWMYFDKTPYSYLFRDDDGRARAYFTFVFVHGPEGPFMGTMKITELIFDSPEALRNVFGFIFGMRAKITDVSVALPADIDLSIMLPESDSVKRTLDGHIMARALNVDGILYAMRQPEGRGRYSIHITDGFLRENTGTYTVVFENGRTVSVTKNEASADLDITAETFCQLAVGRIDLESALYRGDTALKGNKNILKQVFVKKPLFFC